MPYLDVCGLYLITLSFIISTWDCTYSIVLALKGVLIDDLPLKCCVPESVVLLSLLRRIFDTMSSFLAIFLL
jgi:hypothetical protein